MPWAPSTNSFLFFDVSSLFSPCIFISYAPLPRRVVVFFDEFHEAFSSALDSRLSWPLRRKGLIGCLARAPGEIRGHRNFLNSLLLLTLWFQHGSLDWCCTNEFWRRLEYVRPWICLTFAHLVIGRQGFCPVANAQKTRWIKATGSWNRQTIPYKDYIEDSLRLIGHKFENCVMTFQDLLKRKNQ